MKGNEFLELDKSLFVQPAVLSQNLDQLWNLAVAFAAKEVVLIASRVDPLADFRCKGSQDVRIDLGTASDVGRKRTTTSVNEGLTVLGGAGIAIGLKIAHGCALVALGSNGSLVVGVPGLIVHAPGLVVDGGRHGY